MGALPPVRRVRSWWRGRLAILSLATVGLSIACAPSRPAPTPAPVPVPVSAPIPVPEKPVPVDRLAEPWIVGVPSAPIVHELTVTTAVRAAATTAELVTAHVDSSRTTLTVRWDTTSRTPARVGAVIAYRLGTHASGSPGDNAVPAGLVLPVALSASLDADRGLVRITTPSASGCGVDAAAAQVARELLLAPPRRLARGISWVDSMRTTVCRDSIPLVLTSIRRYVVEDARMQDGRAVVVIRRRSTMTLSGTGTQFGEPVTITGDGQGELLFGLRLEDGQMTDGNGVSTLTLTLTGRRKSQLVTQNARLEIRQR